MKSPIPLLIGCGSLMAFLVIGLLIVIGQSIWSIITSLFGG